MPKNTRRSAATYQEAMTALPHARRFEFEYPLALAAPRNGEVVVDFPSGGGYLEPYLHAIAPGASCHAVEHVAGYKASGGEIMEGDWEHLPFEAGSVDIVMTIAALHHVFPGREKFYRECHRVLRPSGRLVIADVAAGTPADRFLSEFVDRFSAEGHTARFFRRDRDIPEIESEGFRVSSYDVRDFHWYFPDKRSAIAFCKGLFRLDLASHDEVWDGLNRYLGLETVGTDVMMNWQLAFIRCDMA